MSKKEMVFVVSRAFALLLIIWALLDLSYLPEHLFRLYHHARQQSVLTTPRDYWANYYLLGTATVVLRVIVQLVASAAFWRCGPRIQALFSNRAEPTTP